MRKSASLLCAALLLGVNAASSKDLKVTVTDDHDSWWLAPEVPAFSLAVSDTLGNVNNGSVLDVKVTDDKGVRTIMSCQLFPEIRKGGKATFGLDVEVKAPGFYRLSIADDGNQIFSRVFGYEPENVVSLPDYQPDFDEFWKKALDELAAVPVNAVVEKVADKPGEKRDMFLVTYDSTDGETLRSYLLMPKAPGKYPVKIIYNGYGGRPWDIDVDGNPEMIEFIASTRGQFLCEDINRYGDWIRYHIEDPSTYYYRGAYQDVVRAIDYVVTLEKADLDRIYAEGGSQGGAFSYAAAALDDRLAAIAPYIPFMGDFPDYLDVAKWPASNILAEADEQGLDRQKVLANMSYFDTKNLARRIKCPVFMGVGLQDPVCPPHINFAPYNLLDGTLEKEFVIYPEQQHGVERPDWDNRSNQFLLRHKR